MSLWGDADPQGYDDSMLAELLTNALNASNNLIKAADVVNPTAEDLSSIAFRSGQLYVLERALRHLPRARASAKSMMTQLESFRAQVVKQLR